MLSIHGTTQKIEAILAGAITTVQLPITVHYEESKGGPGKPARRTTHTATNSGSAVTALENAGAGGTRTVNGIIVHNADSASATVTLRLSDTSTGAAVTRTLFKAALLTLETLYFTKERGFFVLDANGLEKTSASGNSTTTSTADSKAESAGLATSVAVSKTTSYDTAEDVTVSVADSKAESAVTAFALADSVVLSKATSLDTANDVVDSTINSTNLVQSTAISTAVANDAVASVNFSKLKSSGNGSGL